MDQKIRFLTSDDGVRLAYASSGSGTPLLKTANWLNHLEFDWQSPVWRHWFDLFSSHHTLHRYDVRGTGLSDRSEHDLSFERQVADLEQIADALGLAPFALLGISQGASVAIEYAARHPERVSKIVVVCGFVQGWARRGAGELRRGRALAELVRVGWGSSNPVFRRMFAELILPQATPEQVEWYAELQRRSASPDIAARIMEACGEIDVCHRLSAVQAPTLVFHARRDALVPFEAGRVIAAGIPDSQFIELDTANHVPLEGEPSWLKFCAATGEFLGWPGSAANVADPVGEENMSDLTSREREILALVARGSSNGEIAARLHISEKTVRNHLTAVFDKLGVNSRSQAIVFARDRGVTGTIN
jgi:pimeloyl-ACP methyl ester carboxylesterase/DNA-binding CsgD family transcriptional regulator